MSTTEIVAQIVGVVAMLFNILSYQGKSKKTVIALQLVGGMLFAVNYLMLGALMGGILNIIATVRAIIFLFKDKFKADHIAWLFVFAVMYMIIYIVNFTIFKKPITAYNLVIEILPVIGMLSLNIGFRLENAAGIRKCALVSSPSWLTYNVAVGSWGAIICEVFTLISIFVGMFRHDKKHK